MIDVLLKHSLLMNFSSRWFPLNIENKLVELAVKNCCLCRKMTTFQMKIS